MPLKKLYGTMNVLEAARRRIQNAFDSGARIYMAFSSGKDSLVMSSITYDMIRAGEISAKQLTVIFIDEEGIYKSMEEAALRWRRKFQSIGVEFWWFCLPVKQVSVIDHLSATESWITWEPGKEDVWIRKPPEGAIMSHPILEYPGQMNYQTFCKKLTADGVEMVGLRTAESLTRVQAVANTNMGAMNNFLYPIYDWSDSDVWLYIKEHGLEFPDIYIRLYEAGTSKRNLRLCAFFGDNGINGLKWVAETDHELWDRIEKREPNAYLVMLYWDSEMFRRNTAKRRDDEKGQPEKDYKALVEDVLFRHPESYTIPSDTKAHLNAWKGLYIKTNGMAQQWHYKRMYEALLYGDPKRRVLRILWSTIFGDYATEEYEKN